MSGSFKTQGLLLFLAASFSATSAQAVPCARCDSYRSLVQFSTLSSKVAEIGLNGLHTEGRQFAAAEEEAAHLRLRITSNDLIPAECRKQLLDEVSAFTLHFSVQGATAPLGSIVRDTKSGSRLLGVYEDTFNNVYGSHAGKTEQDKAFSKYGDFLNRDPNEVASTLQITPGEVKILRLYHSLLNSGSEKNALALVKSRKDGLSNDQFLTFIQMLGSKLSDDYDNERAGKAFGAKGAVNGDAMLAAARSSLVSGAAGNSGVCRDISSFQGKLLDARGFKNTYVVAHSVEGNYHVTVITQDPDRPRTLYQFNYGKLKTEKEIDGSLALFQGGADVATQYRIYKPGGSQVAVVPSEMGKFLSEAAGFDIHVMDPLGKANGWMASADGQVGKFQLRALTGADGNGASYAGGAAQIGWGEGSHFPGKVGFFAGHQNRPAEFVNGTADKNAFVAYLQVEQHFKTSDIKLSPKLKLTVDNTLTLSAMAHKGIIAGSGLTGDLSGDGDLRDNTEVRLTHDDGRFHGVYRAGFQLSPGLRDVRNLETPTLAFNHAYAGATVTLKLKDVTLFNDTLLVFDQMGARGKLEAGAAGRYVAGSAYVAGRLTGDTALLQDNSLRRAGLSFIFSPIPQVHTSVTGEIPIEGDDVVRRMRVFGRAGFDF